MTAGVVIVGGSVAGVHTARALRERGYTGRVRVVEAETEAPYDKPPLSKAALDGDPRVPLLTDEAATALGIDLILGRRVTELSTATSTLVLDDGSEWTYEQLVIATGAAARPAPWSCPGVHVLRTLADARALRAGLSEARELLVVGAGFIGAELASLARGCGIAVTMVDEAELPMARVAGAVLGARFAGLHREHAVDTRFGVRVGTLEHDGERVRAELSDGSVVHADIVAVGIGAVPDIGWLASAGLPVRNGLECDEFGRVRGHDRIHAVGDVACWHQPRSGTAARIEHWTNAIEQAVCVAHNIVHPDEPVPHDPVAYVWSDQYDWKIQLIGARDLTRDPQIIEQPEPFRMAALWSDEHGIVTGGVTVNWPRASVRMRKAVGRDIPAAEIGAQLTGVPA
ncbi:NAD(P)/FAD-dependent oxidoreductase [Nocardia australiensis]|uniref:NAD(P)/FAD-dependent oxidoreductase n=1 Tax=Nocardia australiensis TaxID=2887191 RepID=UPI001D139C55|nr:FAD-dependent oxidoreductase [Nocardia australiensis]